MESYAEMRQRHQEEFNALPVHYAFGQQQINEEMGKLGLCNGKDGRPTKKDLEQIIPIGAGGFMRKEDYHLFTEQNVRHCKEFNKAIVADETGEGFCYEMFLTELNNHEYGYTGDIGPAIAACGCSIQEINENDNLGHGLAKAVKEIIEWREKMEESGEW